MYKILNFIMHLNSSLNSEQISQNPPSVSLMGGQIYIQEYYSPEEEEILMFLKSFQSKLHEDLIALKSSDKNKNSFSEITILENMLAKHQSAGTLAHISEEDPVFNQVVPVYAALRNLKKSEAPVFTAMEKEYLCQILSIRVLLSTFNEVLSISLNRENFAANRQALSLLKKEIEKVYGEALKIFENKEDSFPNPFSTSADAVKNQNMYKTKEEMKEVFSIQQKAVANMLGRFDSLESLQQFVPQVRPDIAITLLLQLLAIHELPVKERATVSSFLSSIFAKGSPRLNDIQRCGILERDPIVEACTGISENYIKRMEMLKEVKEKSAASSAYINSIQMEVEEGYAKDKAKAETELIWGIAAINNLSCADVSEKLKSQGFLSSPDIRAASNAIEEQKTR